MQIAQRTTRLLLLTVVGALLLSACTLYIDPEAAATGAQEESNSLFTVPPVEISAEMPYETQFVDVLGSQMAYVEAGEGDPILFLHGNPTSKYLWRNVMPWMEGQGRVVALDLIGMGESDKPDIGYTFAEHSEYLDGFIEALDLQNITLVIHDWGSGLGLDYAARHPENVKGIAMMEAVVAPAMPAQFDRMPPNMVEFFQAMRTEGVGEELVLNQNMFVEQLLPNGVVRGLTDAEMEHYRAPYPDPESRLPTLVWPREVPIDGEPADVVERVNAYNEWLMGSTLPKLHIYVSPGAINPPEVVDFLSQTLTNYETVYVGQGLHFIQEDHPEAIGRAIRDWYRRNGQ
jgi:haloalkane dehalogenase